MEKFWEFAKLAAILATVIIALLLILLSLPQSRLRQFLFRVFSGTLFAATGLCVLYILSPADLIPDLIPLLGQVDDAAALVTAIFSGIGAIVFYTQGRGMAPNSQPPKQIV